MNWDMPKIIRESSAGYQTYDIRDEMLSRRELECIGKIGSGLVHSLYRQLLHLQREDPQEEITMYISSPGGSVSGAMALYDVMKAVSCPIRTVCFWAAQGAAALILAAGDQRDLLPHSRVSLHIATSSEIGMRDGDPGLRGGRGRAAELLAQLTGKTRDEAEEAMRSERWLTTQEAIAFGLADRVIQTL